MRLIDADAFKEEVKDMTVKFNLDPVRCLAIYKIIDRRPTAIDLSNIIIELDKRVETQLNIISGLDDPVYRYGFTKSLEEYQQCKLILEDLIELL